MQATKNSLFGEYWRETLNLKTAVMSVMVLANIAAYTTYNWSTFVGTAQPNVVSWGLWSFITILSSSSYFKMSGDPWKSVLPTLNCLLSIVTFVVALTNGKAVGLGLYDQIVLGIGLVACFAWFFTGSAKLTNILVLSAIAIGFIPTYISVWKNPISERTLSWMLWTICYPLGAWLVLLRWKEKDAKREWAEMAYPVSSLVFNGAVAVLSLRS